MSSRHSPQGDGGPSTSQRPTALTFAGASFVPAASDDPGVLVFTSGDDQPSPRLPNFALRATSGMRRAGKAQASVAMLESMGLAGKWQKAGSVRPHPGLPPGGEGDTESGLIEVSVQNSGPVGAETSIRVRTGGSDIRVMSKALGALGIEIGA